MNRPPVRRGGYFRARSSAWMKAHTEARWTPENPAPKWWAELDAAWQIDAGILPSIRDFAEFLGWKKSTLEGLLKEVFGDIERWSEKSWTNPGQSPDDVRTKPGHLEKEERRQLPTNPDDFRTEFGQSPDVPCARAPLSNLNSRLQTEIRSEFRPSAIPDQTPQVHLFAPIGFPPAEAAGASSPVQTPPAIPEAPIKPPGAVSGASEEKPAPQLSPDVMAVWQAWKSWRPGSGPVPPDSVAPMLKAAVKKYKADLVIDVIRWAQSSPHSRARFLRGERNGVVDRNELCTIKTVLRHLDEYGEFARAEAASQPWHRAQAAGGTVIDPEGNVEPIKPQKPAGKRSDSFESAVSTYDLAQRLRAEEEAHHGFGS